MQSELARSAHGMSSRLARRKSLVQAGKGPRPQQLVGHGELGDSYVHGLVQAGPYAGVVQGT